MKLARISSRPVPHPTAGRQRWGEGGGVKANGWRPTVVRTEIRKECEETRYRFFRRRGEDRLSCEAYKNRMKRERIREGE